MNYCGLQGLFNNYPWPAQRQTPNIVPDRYSLGKATRHMWCFSRCRSLEQAASHLIARPITAHGDCTAGSDAEKSLSPPDIWAEGGYEVLVYALSSKSPNISANEGKSDLQKVEQPSGAGSQNFCKPWNCGGRNTLKRQGQRIAKFQKSYFKEKTHYFFRVVSTSNLFLRTKKG